jgi:hypothetical protein
VLLSPAAPITRQLASYSPGTVSTYPNEPSPPTLG